MSLKSFDELLILLQEGIPGLETDVRRCVPPAERIVTTFSTTVLHNVSHAWLFFIAVGRRFAVEFGVE